MRQYQLDIQISNNKIVGILVNGQSVQSTNSCYNTTIKIGDPIQNVLQYCGKPFLVTQTMAKIKNTEPIKLIYSPNDYTSPITFVFQNGKEDDFVINNFYFSNWFCLCRF